MSVITIVLAAALAAAAQQDPVAAARDLYAAAAYEDALELINRLPTTDPRTDQGRSIEQYRAFCLLALGRSTEAERAIETMVSAAPAYRPSATDLSPRVRTAFSDVRRRLLPAIVQRKYGEAKAAFDRKEFAAAAEGFSLVMELLGDPDVGAAANQPPLSDLRTLAAGFHDLSAKAAAPPPPPPLVQQPLTVSAPAPPPAAPAPVAPPRIYSSDDPDVVPPIIVRQTLPPFPGPNVPQGRGIIEVIIDELGGVEQAAIRVSVNAIYDRLAIGATRTWRYKPATVNGVPVKFRKAIQITLTPR